MNVGKTTFAFLLFLSIIQSTFAIGLFDGLGSNFAFDNNLDNSHNTSTLVPNGTINGSASFVTGLIEQAISFNTAGSQFMLPETFNVTFQEDLTNFAISAWVYLDASGDYDIYHISDASGTNRDIAFGIRNVAGVNYAYAHVQGTTERSTTPIVIGEWTHIGITRRTNNVSFFVNGEITGRSTFTTNLYMGLTSQLVFLGGNPFNSSLTLVGRMDEFSIWFYRNLSNSDITELYNDGFGLPYSGYSLQLPTQIASFADIDLSFLDTQDLFMDSFFTGYDEISIAFPDSIQGANVFLSAEVGGNATSYISPHIKAYLTPIGNNIRVRFVSNQTVFSTTVNFRASNGLGVTQDFVALTVGGTTNPPEQIATIVTPVILGRNESVNLNLNNFFINYDTANISFTDANVGASVNLYANKTSGYAIWNQTWGSITLYGAGSSIRILLNATPKANFSSVPFETEITVKVSNSAGTVQSSFDFIIDPTKGLVTGAPPTQISTPVPIILEAGESRVVRVADYFTNYTGFQTFFNDNILGATVFIGGTTTYQHEKFFIAGTGEGFTITAGESSYTQVISLRATNEYGATIVNLNVVINAGEYPTNETSAQGSYASGPRFIDNLFPAAETLTFRQRMSYVVFTLLLLAIVLYMVIYQASEGNSLVSGLVVLTAMIAALIFFIAIGYIPVIIVILLAVIAAYIVYLYLKKGGD